MLRAVCSIGVIVRVAPVYLASGVVPHVALPLASWRAAFARVHRGGKLRRGCVGARVRAAAVEAAETALGCREPFTYELPSAYPECWRGEWGSLAPRQR